MRIVYCLGLAAILSACSMEENQDSESMASSPEKDEVYSTEIRELSDQQYPDNPDISIRHALDGSFKHPELQIERNLRGLFDLTFSSGNENSTEIILADINLMEWIPTSPDWVLKDDYLTYISIINQEWNRHQVKFSREDLLFKDGAKKESRSISRLDLARNCINAYLWEVIAYGKNDMGEEQPLYHGWFNFPKELYAELFNERNGGKWNDFQTPLENWVDPDNKWVDLEALRKVINEQEVPFSSLNHQLYPEVGERKKKKINVLHPKSFGKIDDFLSDSTLYATFSPPGIYNTRDPRKTELGRFKKLQRVIKRNTQSYNEKKEKNLELEFLFTSNEGDTVRMLIGGLNPREIPPLEFEGTHKGFQMPMGIANHSFYESYEFQQEHPSLQNPYFGVLLDAQGNWLDSHKMGIDGPLFHWDPSDPEQLHLWILSFERHSFVGHYVLNLKEFNYL